MNNNKINASALEAHCKGVFSQTTYITVGNEENPLGCGVKEPLPERWKAKQFSTQPPKKGKTLDTYFEKTFTSIANDKYTDKWRYLDSGQEKQKGFGTSDFSKRDEFSNTTRTLQWREQLAHEAKWTEQAINFFNEAAAQTSGSSQAGGGGGGSLTQQLRGHSGSEPDALLYDLVFEKAADHRSPACSHTHRDTKNHTMLCRDRHLGGQLTTNALMFTAPNQFDKPEFARKPLIRDTFYRKTNVAWPQGCDATTAS